MSNNNRNRQSSVSAPSLLGAALGVVVGLAAAEHAHAQHENRESVVQGLVRWVRDDVLELHSHTRRPRMAGAAARRILTRGDITALPIRTLTNADLERSQSLDSSRSVHHASDKNFCVICHDNYAAGDSLMRLPCFHEYHAECIRDYLESTEDPMCPVCRHPVTIS